MQAGTRLGERKGKRRERRTVWDGESQAFSRRSWVEKPPSVTSHPEDGMARSRRTPISCVAVMHTSNVSRNPVERYTRPTGNQPDGACTGLAVRSGTLFSMWSHGRSGRKPCWYRKEVHAANALTRCRYRNRYTQAMSTCHV